MAALREPWTPATHRRFPPVFRAATKTLLLVARRGAAVAAAELEAGDQQAAAAAAELPAQPSNAALLAQLPTDVLQQIIRLAAYPLSAWQPAVDMEQAEMMAHQSKTYQEIMMEEAMREEEEEANEYW